MSLGVHCVHPPGPVAGGLLECFRGIRRKGSLKIDVIPDAGAGEPVKTFRRGCRRLVCLSQPGQNEAVCLGNDCVQNRKETLGFQGYSVASGLSYDRSVVVNQSPHPQRETHS